jgi:superfamily II DNA or RNA helicase
MNLGLTFTAPRRVDTPTGAYMLREAIATDAFWRAYKKQTFEQLQSVGVSLVKQGRGYVIQIHEPVDGNIVLPAKPLYQLRNTTGLYEWQIPHAGHLVAVLDRHGAALDGSDTGTGKTYTAISVARERGLRPLIVSPKVGMRKWADVCVKLGVKFRCVVGWEEAKTVGFPYTAITWGLEKEIVKDGAGRSVYKTKKVFENIKWKAGREELLIFDEAHRAKGRKTQNAQLMAQSHGIPTLMLSATIADSPRDMWACGSRLNLHNRHDFNAFCEKLFCFKDKAKGWSIVDREASSKGLHKLIYPEHGSRIRIKDLGDAFPADHVTAELINVPDAEKFNAHYSHLLKRVESLHEAGKNADVLVERLRFRQAAELQKMPGMIELAEDYSEEGNGVAMFVGFRETLDLLYKHFGKNECAVIYGGQNPTERENERLRFENNEVPYIACMIQAGGISCDMHDVKGKPRVSLISPCDNATMVKQVLGRIRRAGGLSPARQLILYAANTVEERVYENIVMKIHAIDTINDGDLMEKQLVSLGPAFKEDA